MLWCPLTNGRMLTASYAAVSEGSLMRLTYVASWSLWSCAAPWPLCVIWKPVELTPANLKKHGAVAPDASTASGYARRTCADLGWAGVVALSHTHLFAPAGTAEPSGSVTAVPPAVYVGVPRASVKGI